MIASAHLIKRKTEQRIFHGEHITYRRGCQCVACRAAHSEYVIHRNAERLAGRPSYVDATPARKRIVALQRQGWSLNAIVAASGLTDGVVDAIRYRHQQTTRPDTIAALQAVNGIPSADRVLVPAARTRTLLARLLSDEGASYTSVAREAGVTRQQVYNIASGRSRQTYAETARTVERIAIERGHVRSAPGEAVYALDAETFDRIVSAAGWQLEAVLEAAGVDPASYAQWRIGRPVSEVVAERLAIALGVRVESVFRSAA